MRFRIYQWIIFVLFGPGMVWSVNAQTGIGLRYSTYVNHFFQAPLNPLMDYKFSNIVFGGFFRHYKKHSGIEVGFDYIYKGPNNIPFVAQDFKSNNVTSFQGGQFNFLFGPQFNLFRPKTGYILGFRSEPKGFLDNWEHARKLNHVYMFIPLGLSVDFPTNFGTVGGSFFYLIGMTNVIRDPNPGSGFVFDGGRQRALQFEITVLYGVGKAFRTARQNAKKLAKKR